MSQATPFVPGADYSADITPGDLGNALDADFDDIKLTTDEIRANLALIQRDDGLPANATVHPDALTTATLALIASDWTVRGAWLTATLYAIGDVVENSGTSYVCAVEHVSGTFATDDTAGKWVQLSDRNVLLFSTAGGTADAITANFSITALLDGQSYYVSAAAANTTTTPTLNATSLGAKTIVKNGNQALVAGDIFGSGHVLHLVYRSGIDKFELLNPGVTISAYARTLLDDVDAPTARATLGATVTGDAVFIAASAAAARTAIDASKTEPSDAVFRVVGSVDATKKLAFEVDGFTTATTRILTPPDANLTLPNASVQGRIPIATSVGVLGMAAALNKAIYGLTYANNGADATNDIDIAAGGCMDATGAYWITLAALTKQSDVAWAVGTNAGGLDTGVVGNSDYYIWAIARSDTGVTDILFSLSSTAPTMPTNYDFKRLIGWFKRVGGTIVAFTTYETQGGGLELLWNSPTLDVNLVNTLTTARRTDAVKVPLNFSVIANLNVVIDDGTATSITHIYCPDSADVAPSGVGAAPGFIIRTLTTASFAQNMRVRTSATGTIAARSSIATVDAYNVSTLGFEWARRN